MDNVYGSYMYRKGLGPSNLSGLEEYPEYMSRLSRVACMLLGNRRWWGTGAQGKTYAS